MQAVVDDTTTLQRLYLNGIDYIPTHPNSRIYMSVKYLYIGDGDTTAVSARYKDTTWCVNDAGVVNSISAGHIEDLDNNNSIGSSVAFAQVSPTGQLEIVALGDQNAKMIVTASVDITEVIFESNPL